MVKPVLLQSGESTNVPTDTYYCESDAEVAQIPQDAPVGSVAMILSAGGLVVKMKNSDGDFIEI